MTERLDQSIGLTEQQERAVREWADRTQYVKAVRLFGSRAKVHPRNIEQEIAWIREDAERRVAELLEDQEEEEPDEPEPSAKLKVVSKD